MASLSRIYLHKRLNPLEQQRLQRYQLALGQIQIPGGAIPRYTLHPPPTPNNNARPVFMVWDYENIRPPADCTTLVANIDRGIKTVGKEYYMCGGVALGSLTHFDHNQYCDIIEMFPWISLIHIPRADIRCRTDSCSRPWDKGTYKRETDQADIAQIEHMLYYANDIKATGTGIKPTFLVMSDDADFVTATQSLMLRDYQIFGCVSIPTKEQGGFNPLVLKDIRIAWYWDQLVEGKGATTIKTILSDLSEVKQV